MPQISVILSVFNGINYVDKAVTSVLQQNFKDFEFLILDNFSSDGTWTYLQSINDERVKLYRNEKKHLIFYNLNFLLKKANTPLIKLWAHDDIMYPHCLKTFVSFHKQHPEIGFSYSKVDPIDQNGFIKHLNFIDKTPEILSTNQHAHIAFFTGSIAGNISNVTLTRQAIDKAGLFNESMKISGDFDMWVRIARYFPVGYIKNPQIQLRDHIGQLSKNEKLYIYHLTEDLLVYKYLLGYVTRKEKEQGRAILRNHKLLFYYTLMIKALVKGSVRTAWNFCKILAGFDNIFVLTAYFIKNRIIFKKAYAKKRLDNSEFISAYIN